MCLSLTYQLSTIEYSQLQKEIFTSLENGSLVLKQLQTEMSLDKVESVMEGVGEGVAAQRVSLVAIRCAILISTHISHWHTVNRKLMRHS